MEMKSTEVQNLRHKLDGNLCLVYGLQFSWMYIEMVENMVRNNYPSLHCVCVMERDMKNNAQEENG